MWPRAVFAIGPTAFVLGALALYNYARFRSFTDVGQTRTLGGGFNQSKMVLSSVAYIAPNAYYYLVRPIAFAPVFPYLAFDRFAWPFSTPNDYHTHEPVAGVLFTAPLLLFGVVFLLVAVFRRHLRRDDRCLYGVAFLLVASVHLLEMSFVIYGATQRYRVELDLLLTVAALFALSLALSRVRRKRARRLGMAAIAFASLLSVTMALLSSFHGIYPYLDSGNWFTRNVEALTRPIERVALDREPFVRVAPAIGEEQTTLRNLDELRATNYLYVDSRGNCGTEIVFARDRSDPSELVVDTSPAVEVVTSRGTLTLHVPPSGGQQIVAVDLARSDGASTTPIDGARSRYSCA